MAEDLPGDGPPSNIILVVCDTLRADHLGLYGYSKPTSPFLDDFAAGALVYEKAYSHFSYTWPTVSNLFTGIWYSQLVHEKLFVSPKSPNDPGLVDGAVTLAERLTASGVQTRAVVANPYVSSRTGFAQGFGAFHDVYSWDPNFWHGAIHKYTAEQVNEIATRFLQDLKTGEAPFFLYLHYFDPHMPYIAPAFDRSLFEDADYDRKGRVVDGYLRSPDGEFLSYLTPGVESWLQPEDLEHLVDQYDAEIHYFDRSFRELLQTLDDLGLSSSTHVILTADHGEAFMERRFWGHGFLSRNEEEHVPLIVKLANSEIVPSRPHRATTTTDVFFSILEHFDVALTADESRRWGVDVLSGAPRNTLAAYSEGPGNTQILRAGDFALYRYLAINAIKRPIPVENGDVLFDLSRDPGELFDLFETRASDATAIRSRLLERSPLVEGLVPMTAGKPLEDPLANADEETKRRLRALGYLR